MSDSLAGEQNNNSVSYESQELKVWRWIFYPASFINFADALKKAGNKFSLETGGH